jgi:DNA-directed RNA polymerase specialized sigma24 family protein
MPTPKTHVWMTVEAAHDAVGDAAVAVLRVIRERGRPGRPPLPAAEVPRIANWYLVRRVADQVEREMRRCPVPDEELAALRPPPAAMEEITIEKIATRQAMEAIPPAERRAVSLASWGYDGEERARHQRISLVTERKRLSRGRAHLRAAAAA